jgi:glycosyltransferase involved in cell wall biosynthesis
VRPAGNGLTAKQLHVCLISTEILGWGKAGGYGFVVRMMGTELIKRGYRVTAIIPQPRDVVERSAVLDGIEVRSYPRLAFSKGMALFREADADIYHSHEPSLGGWLAMRAMPHRKHVVTNQDPRLLRDWWIEFRHPTYSPFQVLKTAAYYENPLTWRSVRAAHRVMVPAQFLKRIVARKYGLRDEPTFMPTPIRVPQSVSKAAEPTVCYLGRLDRRKRPERFLKLAARFPEVRFICVGEAQDRAYDADLRRRYGAQPNLELTGFIDQFRDRRVSDILAKSWVLINTSAREGLPNTYMEAAAHRCAILSAVDPDGFASRFGLDAPDGDFEAGLKALLTDDLWRRRGNAGFEYVNKTYEVGKAIDRQVALYDEVLGAA